MIKYECIEEVVTWLLKEAQINILPSLVLSPSSEIDLNSEIIKIKVLNLTTKQ